MALTYSTFVTQLANEIVVDPTEPEFVVVLPNIIDYAEQRCYRELDLLSTVIRDSSASLTANSRNFTLPTTLGRFVTVEGVNVITPTGSTTSSGTRNTLASVWRPMIDFLYPTEHSPATPSIPQMFAMITDQTIIVGPAPDAPYNAEVIGTIRPTPLSASNTTTYLSQYLPDVFFAAAMISATAYQKNFGAQSDNPAQAQSWETQYEKLIASANFEEIRKRYGQALEAKMRG
jgi:hypothetical protein